MRQEMRRDMYREERRQPRQSGQPGQSRRLEQKRRKKRRRKRFVRLVRNVLFIGMGIACIVLTIQLVQVLKPLIKEQVTRFKASRGFGEADTSGKALLGEDGREYPEELAELLEKNPETKEFVEQYWDLKDNPPAENVGEVEKGTVPHLLQWDTAWGYTAYGENFLAVTGCGPTCVSMVAAGLTGDNTIAPHKVAAYAQDEGYYEQGAGTSWLFMTEGVKEFGISGQEIGLDKNTIVAALSAGKPIICSMRPGDFTTTGHFIVLTAVEDGKLRVLDPNSIIRSERLWEYEELKGQIRNLWMFSL